MSDTITLVKAADKLFIGMDLHKNTSTFAVKDKEGKLINSAKSSRIKTTLHGILIPLKGTAGTKNYL